MAGAFVAGTSKYVTGVSSVTPTIPSGSENDQLLALVHLYTESTPTVNTPADWTKLESRAQLGSDWALFLKLRGASEGNPTFTISSGTGQLHAWVADLSGLAVSSVVDGAASDTVHTDWDTILRGGGVTVSAQPVTVFMFGACYASGLTGISVPTGGGWTEDIDAVPGDSGAWLRGYLCHKQYTANGATGDQDATMNASDNFKHGFMVALKEASAPAGTGLWVPSHYDGGLYDRMQGGI